MAFVHVGSPAILSEIESKQTAMGRFYKSPTSNLWFPSVTTVTGHSKKDFFAQWRSNPENQKELTRASVRGSKLHSIIEKYLENIQVDPTSENYSLFEQLKPNVDKINNIAIQEVGLWSDAFRLAGRVDCIGEYEGKLSVIDFKGSTKPKKEEWIVNYFEQATCYALMYQERFNIPIKQIVILVGCENGTPQVFVKKTSDYVVSLSQTIKNYWKDVDFKTIQEICNE